MGLKHKWKRRSSQSPHEKQMRFLAVLFIVLVLVIFALAFYCVNRWTSPVAL